jgi:hypothetical protein
MEEIRDSACARSGVASGQSGSNVTRTSSFRLGRTADVGSGSLALWPSTRVKWPARQSTARTLTTELRSSAVR